MPSQIDFIQYKFEHYKQYFINENSFEEALNHWNFVKSRRKRNKHFG